jgi:hypothetical protein
VLTNNFTDGAVEFLDALRLAADDGDGSRPIRCHWKILGARKLPVRLVPATERGAGACPAFDPKSMLTRP